MSVFNGTKDELIEDVCATYHMIKLRGIVLDNNGIEHRGEDMIDAWIRDIDRYSKASLMMIRSYLYARSLEYHTAIKQKILYQGETN